MGIAHQITILPYFSILMRKLYHHLQRELNTNLKSLIFTIINIKKKRRRRIDDNELLYVVFIKTTNYKIKYEGEQDVGINSKGEVMMKSQNYFLKIIRE